MPAAMILRIPMFLRYLAISEKASRLRSFKPERVICSSLIPFECTVRCAARVCRRSFTSGTRCLTAASVVLHPRTTRSGLRYGNSWPVMLAWCKPSRAPGIFKPMLRAGEPLMVIPLACTHIGLVVVGEFALGNNRS